MSLQWATVVLLMLLGFYVIWTGRKVPPHTSRDADVFADITGEERSLRVRCVTDISHLRQRIETFPQDVESMEGRMDPSKAKLAVFTNIPRRDIPDEAARASEYLGVALLPTEALEETLAAATSGLTAVRFHERLVGGLVNQLGFSNH